MNPSLGSGAARKRITQISSVKLLNSHRLGHWYNFNLQYTTLVLHLSILFYEELFKDVVPQCLTFRKSWMESTQNEDKIIHNSVHFGRYGVFAVDVTSLFGSYFSPARKPLIAAALM